MDLAGHLADALQRAHHGNGADSWLVVRTHLYAIPAGEAYLLYSPLQGLVLLVHRAGVARLLLETDAPVAACLAGCELEGDSELLGRFDAALPAEPVRFTNKGWDFKPTNLMLSLTAACQLACDYCYIRGGDNPRNMPWEVTESAIRFVAGNAFERGDCDLDIQFHGQGEPTAAWRLFRDAVQFAEIQARAHDLNLSLSVVSNGVLTRDKVAFIAEHKIGIGLSLDGLKESNDAQRPLRSGGSTYDRVVATMRMLRDYGVDFSLRSTVTKRNVGEMTAFVREMKTAAGCDYIHFEPMCNSGRASEREDEAQSVLPSFVEGFRTAQTEGAKIGVDVSYSTARIGTLRTSFCGAYGANLNFCVSTEGLVSSCYEVLEASDPRSDLFVYGRYDPAERRFLLDRARMEALVDLDVTKMARCGDCFLKWNCGGDCISKASLHGISHVVAAEPLERCAPSRAVAKEVLLKAIVENVDSDLAEGMR